MRINRPVFRLGILLAAGFSGAFGQGALHEPEERVIHYNSLENLADPVSILQRELAKGDAKLDFEAEHGYLISLLKLLNVPTSSQALVFSKTSLQADRVSPKTPRAVYFNDNIYISWVPGGDVIDLSAVDPNKGPIFYTLDQQPAPLPRFTRPGECMQCHIGPKTLGVPGHLLRSVVTAENGYPLFQMDDVNGDGTPFIHRWGGWYVTGTMAGDVHMGNLCVLDRERSHKLDVTGGAGCIDLRKRLDASRYPSLDSDVVALMVLAHQAKMQNLITRANYEARFALDPEMAAQSPNWAKLRIGNAAEPLLEYMLFRDEAPLHGPVKGTSGFEEHFQQIGPRDSKGRSLRDLDLKTRLMRYPCSFLIYSQAFDGLPAVMKNYLWRRLSEILSGKDHSETYAAMSGQDREAIFEILRDTKPEFAAWVRGTSR